MTRSAPKTANELQDGGWRFPTWVRARTLSATGYRPIQHLFNLLVEVKLVGVRTSTSCQRMSDPRSGGSARRTLHTQATVFIRFQTAC